MYFSIQQPLTNIISYVGVFSVLFVRGQLPGSRVNGCPITQCVDPVQV